MILSFGYLISRQLLHLAILVLRGDRANEVEILVLSRCTCPWWWDR